MTAVVFLGPSLSRAVAGRHLDAIYRPPASRGDVYRAARDLRPSAILLIDGRFHDTAAVWHREILWALGQGVHVFGAASMGALRAAETDRFGMRGVGRVYEAYRIGRYEPYTDPFDDDGEVAVVHGPQELGCGALSIALVDLRQALATCSRDGLITAAERDMLVADAAAVFHADRTPERVEALIAARIRDAAIRCQVAARAVSVEHGIKAVDAVAALAAVAGFLAATPAPFVPAFSLEPALVWERFRHVEDEPACDEPGALEAEVLDEVRIDPAAWRSLRRHAALRLAACRPASDRDRLSDLAARRQALSALRRARGLDDRVALEAWMTRNALTPTTFEALVETEAVLQGLADQPAAAIQGAMLDILRLDGRFEILAARARKRPPARAPRTTPAARSARETSLLSRFIELHPAAWDMPPDVPTLLSQLDCRDEAQLFAVLEKACDPDEAGPR